MTLDDLPFDYPSPATNNGGSTRKCRRHGPWIEQRGHPFTDADGHVIAEGPLLGVICSRCFALRNPERSRRGRTNRSRGNAIERWVCKLLGIQRRGMYGGPDDGGDSDDWITVQVKSGGAYPERIDALLRALPERAGQMRGVVHTDAPGPGTKRRALITLDLYDFAAWYGGKGTE